MQRSVDNNNNALHHALRTAYLSRALRVAS
jgi:hypothetical protein